MHFEGPVEKLLAVAYQIFRKKQWADSAVPNGDTLVHSANPVIYFHEVDKTCVRVFGMFPRFLENLLESRILFCCATAATKAALGIIQLWFHYFFISRQVFTRQLAYTFPGKNFAQFCQVRWQRSKGKHHMKFLVFTSRSKTSFFSFSQRFQCGPNSQNLIPSSHSCLTRQLPCFECAQQLPTLCLYYSVMHRQASRSQR